MADDNTPQESEKEIEEVRVEVPPLVKDVRKEDEVLSAADATEEHAISLVHTLKRAKLEAEIAKHKQESLEKEQVFLDAKEKFEALTTDPIAFAKKLAKEKLLFMFSEKYRLQTQLDDLDNIEKKAKLKQDLEDDANKKQEAYDKLRGAIQPTTAVSEGGDLQNAVGTGRIDDSITQNASLGSLTSVLNDINDSIISGNDTREEQLRTDRSQFKKDNTTSAAEEVAAGRGSEDASGLPSVDVEKPKKSKGFNLPNPMDGLNGIMGNVLGKFGKAGSFLMSLGSKFLMPLITTPVGWAVLAGLAVGGLVFAYWDEIKATISSIFDKVGDMMSAIGDSIMEIVDFLNPMNLLPMIAKALLPTEWYGAVSSFFGGDNAEEIKSKEKKETLKKEMAVGDKMEADLSSAKSEQRNLGKSLKSKHTIAAEKDGEVITIKVGQVFEGIRLRSPNHANLKLRRAGYKVLSPEETKAIMEENAKDIKLKEFDLDVQMEREGKLIDEVSTLDESVAAGKIKNDKPRNVVADLVRAGTAEYNILGNSVINDWPALRKLDYESLEKVLDFDDWDDNTKRGILSIMNSKKQLIGANDTGQEPQSIVALNPNVINEKQRNIQNTNKLALDNKVSDTPVSDNTTQITNAPTSLTNNTTNNTVEDKSHDSDFTNSSLNRSPQYGMNAF